MTQPQSGQVTTEIVLMLALTMMIAIAVQSAARNSNWMASLVSGPWQNLSSIVQNGVPGSPNQAAQLHPNNYSRWSSVKGDDLK